MYKTILKKIYSFFKSNDDIKNIDPTIFDNIDASKESNGINFEDYFLDYLDDLPELDFESAIKISREVYQSFGKETEFDSILEQLINSHSIESGSLNKEDENCVTKATESRIILTGTCYDVILLCHEIGHKLRYDDSYAPANLSDSFLFETPSIIMELAASDHLRDNYGINLNVDDLRRTHVLSKQKEDSIETKVFSTVMQTIKEGKPSIISMYKKVLSDKDIALYLSREDTSIENCVDEGLTDYSYDVGYILGHYTNNADNKIDLLNAFLKYKDKGIDFPFTVDKETIKEAVSSKEQVK